MQQQQKHSTNSPDQHTRSRTTWTAPASATPTSGVSRYKTASTAVVTGIEPAAPAVSKQKDDDDVYIRVPREKVAPADTGRTETVHQHVSQRAGPQNAAPVLRLGPVQLPAPGSQQWLGDYITISYALFSVSQPGGSRDTSVDTVDTEPHMEAATHCVARRLAVPSESAAAEVKVLMDSG